jgi:hypothetical protein
MNGVSGVNLACGFCLTSKEKSANATTVLFDNLLSTKNQS